jgi:hypothetical protein
MPIRVAIPPEHRVIVLGFRFDMRLPEEKAAARYLARAPMGRKRSRARELILDGYREHLAGQGVTVSQETVPQPRRSSIQIDGIYYDLRDSLQARCAAYLKRSQYGARRDKAHRLLIAGFQKQHSRDPQKKGNEQ